MLITQTENQPEKSILSIIQHANGWSKQTNYNKNMKPLNLQTMINPVQIIAPYFTFHWTNWKTQKKKKKQKDE